MAKKLFTMGSVAVVLVGVALFFLLSSGNGNHKGNDKQDVSHQQVITKPEKNDKTPVQSNPQVDREPDTGKTSEPPVDNVPKTTEKPVTDVLPPETVAAIDIILGDNDRFGSNWTIVATGVKITRLSNGPLKSAGIKVGDVLTEVAGEKVKGGDNLLKIRGEIFSGLRNEALIKVVRDNQPIFSD